MSSPHKEPSFRIVHRSQSPAGAGRAVVEAGGVRFGRGFAIIAGPCTVESADQTIGAAKAALAAGAVMIRGGAYKTRTSPYDFQGLGEKGLEILVEARRVTGLPFVTEVIDPGQVERVAARADMLQVGTRNMHNTPLLKELGKCGKPVLLKRGWASTVNEWLCAAEYVALAGNTSIVLCERGIRTDPRGKHSSPSLDFGAIAEIRRLSWLPVIVDPSHGTEDASKVPEACRLAAEAGADGLMIEILPPGYDAGMVRCDGHQSVTPETLAAIAADARRALDDEK